MFFFKYKLFIVKKSSEEVKTFMFSIITDFFLAFPSLILFDRIVNLFVCLDERHQMSPRLKSAHQHLYSFIVNCSFGFFTGITAEKLLLL